MLHLTGGEALVRALQPEEVPFVFGIVGGKRSRPSSKGSHSSNRSDMSGPGMRRLEH